MKHLPLTLLTILILSTSAIAQGGAVSREYLDGKWKVTKAVYNGNLLDTESTEVSWDFSYAGRVAFKQGDRETIATWNTVLWHTQVIEVVYSETLKETYFVSINSDNEMEFSLLGESESVELTLIRQE